MFAIIIWVTKLLMKIKEMTDEGVKKAKINITNFKNSLEESVEESTSYPGSEEEIDEGGEE